MLMAITQQSKSSHSIAKEQERGFDSAFVSRTKILLMPIL